jgi:acetolactate synthase I/II/III large subunit
MRHGGKILIDQLVQQGTDSVFLIPGESYLAALDGLFEAASIKTIICRHEGGATMMAEATGKLTGRPGIAFATRGPGAVNAVSGLYVAKQDQTPLILFVGLPARAMVGRSAFQEFDIEKLFGGIAKSVDIVLSPRRIPEYVARAFDVGMSGRPGPVVLGLPEDVLMEAADIRDAAAVQPARSEPGSNVLTEIEDRIAAAQQPMMIVGGPGWSKEVQEAVQAFAIRFDMPVAAAFRAQDYFDNRHSCYVGHLGLSVDQRLAVSVRAADLLIVLGAPLDDIGTKGWQLIKSPDPDQTIIHIHPGGPNPKDGIRPQLSVISSALGFARQLRTIEPPQTRPWSTFRRDLRAAYDASQRPVPTPGGVQLEEIVRMVSSRLPENAIMTSGAGNYAQFVHRYTTYKGYRTCLAPAAGSMGYGVPAAIAASLNAPGRKVVCYAGDGCFQMTMQELGTAVQYGLPLVVIVANNGMHGTIRMHQERIFPERVIGTTLTNPDFAALARSYGARGYTVERTQDFGGVFEEALDHALPVVIDLKLDPEALTPQMTLSQIRNASARMPKDGT